MRMIHPLINQKINELQESIANQQRQFVLVHWINRKQLPVFARKASLFDDILNLQKNHESYHNQPYMIAWVRHIETVNKSRIQSATPQL